MIDDIHDDIDALINELNASSGLRPGDRGVRLETLLEEVISRHGSDLLLVAGSAPGIRVDGAIIRIDGAVLDGTDIEEVVLPLLPPHAKRQYQDRGIADA